MGSRRRFSLGISWLDLKLGLRMLVKQPGLTLVAAFTMAVGIPIGLLPGHVVNSLQAPPPFDEGDRIQAIWNFDAANSDPTLPSWYDFTQWREEVTTFEALGATTRGVTHNVISEDGSAAPVRGAEVTASMFDILRVPPLLGRTLIPADEVIGGPTVVVIGHELWQSRLEGDPDVVGRTLRIGGVMHTVVGVMPEGFLFPFRDNLWLPVRMSVLSDEHGQGRAHLIFGRLSDGISPEEAQVELTTIGRRMAIEFPDMHARLQPQVVPYSIKFVDLEMGGIRGKLEFYLIQALALLVLVVACANVGMLIFARTATRSAELAVRTALGASRARIISQLFTEALVLAVLAAGVGLLLGDRISSEFDWLFGEGMPYWSDLGVTRETVFWALSLAVFSAAIVGVVPALKVTGKAVHQNMQRAGAGRSGIRFGGISSALIITDVAVAMAAGGMAVGFAEGWPEIPGGRGIQAEHFLSAELRIPRIEPSADPAAFDGIDFVSRVSAAQQELVQRLTAEPGVRGVAVGSQLPGMDHPYRRVELEGEDRPHELRGRPVANAFVDVDFFNVLEQPILAGRGFDLNDLGEDRSTVIVNTTFVDRVMGGRNPLGRRVRYWTRLNQEAAPWYEIVGVVPDLGTNETNSDADGAVYHPMAAGEVHPVRLAIHVGDDPESFTPRLWVLASEVDPLAIISNPVALDGVVSSFRLSMMWSRWGLVILIGILIALSASGIYALMSFTVAERTREIGVRTALGAERSDIVFTVARRSLAQLGIGILLGTPIAGVLLFLLKGEFGSTYSPFVVAVVLGGGVMVLIGLLACVAPTLRALRIMPTEALREGG